MLFPNKKKYEVFRIASVAVISNSEGKVLLGYERKINMWKLPGGKLEKGETPWEGLLREVREETNVDVRIDRFVGVYSYKGKDFDSLVFVFRCSIVHGQPSVTKEFQKLHYFAIDELPQNISHRMKERIQDALREEGKTYLKKQM